MHRIVLLPALCLIATLPAAEKDDVENQPDIDTGTVVALAKPVPGFVAPTPGEHPRLFFRRAELPRLRERLKTPTGQAILARLKATLGGGEALPTVYSNAKKAYDSEATSNLPEGAFTVSHAAGFAFLWQLTGDRKYADLSRQCLEKSFSGIRDRDDRYAWVNPGGQLRAGPTLAWHALAYDLGYDGWDEAFRREFARKLMSYDSGEGNMQRLCERPRHFPGSNHFGSQIGGAALTLLAVQGDPGVDAAQHAGWMAKVLRNVDRTLTQGFGDAGGFSEGDGPSLMGANPTLVPAIQALRIAGGRDYSESPNAYWISLRWAHGVTTDGRQAVYPLRESSMGRQYGTDVLAPRTYLGGGMSHGGWFCQGLGAVPERYRAAMAWSYHTFLAPQLGEQFDAVYYPHRAILAYLNWPDAKPADAGAAPLMRYDSVHGLWSVRTRYRDIDDLVVSLSQNRGPRGWGRMEGADLIAYGCGHRITLPGLVRGNLTGSELSPGRWQARSGDDAVLVDGTGLAGVPGVIISTADARSDPDPAIAEILVQRKVKISGKNILVATFTREGVHPRLSVTKNVATLGGMTITWEDGFKISGDKPGLGAHPIDAKELKKDRIIPPLKPEDIKLPPEAPELRVTLDAAERKDVDGRAVFGPAYAVGTPPKHEPGVFGEAVRFEGKGLLRLPPTAVPDPSGRDVSYGLWFRNDGEAGGEMMLLERSAWAKDTPEVFNITTFGGITVANGYWVQKGGPQIEIGFADKTWHHAFVTWNEKKQTPTLYYDGERIGGFKIRAPWGAGRFEWNLGGRGGSPERAAMPWRGLIDDVRWYGRELNRGEIKAIYDEGRASLSAAGR